MYQFIKDAVLPENLDSKLTVIDRREKDDMAASEEMLLQV